MEMARRWPLRRSVGKRRPGICGFPARGSTDAHMRCVPRSNHDDACEKGRHGCRGLMCWSGVSCRRGQAANRWKAVRQAIAEEGRCAGRQAGEIAASAGAKAGTITAATAASTAVQATARHRPLQRQRPEQQARAWQQQRGWARHGSSGEVTEVLTFGWAASICISAAATVSSSQQAGYVHRLSAF